MVSAAIKINGTLGSRSDLSTGSLVTLTNNDDTGATTWLWEFISKPYTSSATIINPTLATATFTPDVVGSYFIKLTVNTSYISKRVAAVRTQNYKLRIPATEETNEFNEDGNTSGWSKAYYDALLGIDGYIFNVTDGYALKTTLDAYATKITLDAYAQKTLLDSYATMIDGYIPLAEIAVDPTALLNTGSIYTKDDGGDTELFYLDDSSNIVQITKDGYVNVNATSVSLPNTQNVYVDGARTDSYIEDGTILRPYKTIQDAVDSITDANWDKFYAINISPEVYYGKITLKSYIGLFGSSMYQTMIVCTAIDDYAIDTNNADQFCLRNMSVYADNVGIYVNGGEGDIRDLEIVADGDAIKLDDTYCYIFGCFVRSNNEYGVHSVNDSRGDIKASYIRGAIKDLKSDLDGSDLGLDPSVGLKYGTVEGPTYLDGAYEAFTGGNVTKKLFVDVNRTDTYTEDGTRYRPFKTIQAAIDAASSGDVVKVLPGTYNESVDMKQRVNLIGEDRLSVIIIDPGSSYAIKANAAQMSIIENIQAYSVDGYGLWVTDGNLQIKNVDFGSDNNSGILVDNADLSTNGFVYCWANANHGFIAANGASVYLGQNVKIECAGGHALYVKKNSEVFCAGTIFQTYSSPTYKDLVVDSGCSITIDSSCQFMNDSWEINGTTNLHSPASFIKNNSLVYGDSVKDALDNLFGGGSGLVDGYLPLPERLTDPPYQDDYGAIYTKDDSYGTTRLYYIDNYGDVGKVITEDTITHETDLSAIQFNIDPIEYVNSEGLVYWDSYNKCLVSCTEDNDVRLQIGQESLIRCYNISGSQINKGEIVYINDSYQGFSEIRLSISSVPNFSEKVIGISTSDIINNSIGYITTFGVVRRLNTNVFNEGDILYLSPDSYGAITNVIPETPNVIVKIGTCLVKDVSLGSIFVDIDRNPSTNTLNDVEGYGQFNGEILIFNAVSNSYEPSNLIAGGNISITNGPGTITIRDLVDGYLNLPERDANAPYEDGYGKLFTKYDDEYGTVELFYIDNYGQVIQLTQDGIIPANSIGGTNFDSNAIHLNRANEISPLSNKMFPITTDLLVIEDSAAGYYKKKVEIGNLPHDAFKNLTDTPSTYVSNGGKYVRVNGIEDALIFNKLDLDGYVELSQLDAYVQKTLLDSYAQKTLLDSYATIIDGYIPLTEKITDPTPVVNMGAIYVKDDGYLTTKLYYMDNYGDVGKVITEDENRIVDLGNLQFNTELDVPAHNKGMMFWDEYNDTVSIYNSQSDVTLQIGQEQYIRGYNHSGSQINNGQAVYVHDDYGYFPQISLARSDKIYMTDRCVGIATHDIPNDSVGFITTFGIVKDVDTSSWVPGSVLYLSPDSYGSLTNVLPSTPNVVLKIAIVLEQDASVGRVFVTITRGQSTGTLDDVSAFGISDGDLLTFNSLTETYEPNTLQAGDNIKIINSPGSILIRSQLDSYLSMPENITDPPYQDGYGGLYTAYDEGHGTTELHYIDNYGQVTQITTNGGLTSYEHDTKSPLGTWLTTSTVSFAARPGEDSIVRKTLGDNRRRIMEDGTWDIANGVADWGYDHVSSQGNSKQLYFYLVPKSGAETTTLVIRASDNIPSVGPIGYTYFKLVWTDYIDSGGLLRQIYQRGNVFQPAYRLYPVTTNPATLGATPVTVKVEYAINDAVPLTAETAEINGFMTMVGAPIAYTGVLNIYVEGQTNLFIQRYTQARYGNTNTISCHIPLPGVASKKIGFQTTITGGAIETTNGRGQGISIVSWVDSYIES